MEDKYIRWVYAAEHTASQFHRDDSFARGLMGPIGSGKSVACCNEIFQRALRQQPSPEGVRHSRWALIRNTYPELKSTTIKTWQDWFPLDVCPIKFDAPICGTMQGLLPDGTMFNVELFFVALDTERDVKKLLSLELTGAWINEAREMGKPIVDAVSSRVGRYPPKRLGGPTWSGFIMDTNPPDTDHWWYRMAEVERPQGWRFWRQPGAFVRRPDGSLTANPLAENVRNQPLSYTYWQRQIAGKDPEWLKVYILGEYGSVFSGKPVYEGLYEDRLHTAGEPLAIIHGLPLRLGWDFGLTPACVAVQLSPLGQLRILREWVCENGALREFVQMAVKPALEREFAGMAILSYADPAGAQRGQVDAATCLGELAHQGLATQPAPTNDFLPRRQAVVSFLSRMVNEGEPGFLLDPSCEILRKGFLGGYKFERVLIVGEERYKEVPDKNRFSHCHDALQYVALGADEFYGAAKPQGKAWPQRHSWT